MGTQPAGAGGAGQRLTGEKFRMGLDERSEEMGGGDPARLAGGAGGASACGLDEEFPFLVGDLRSLQIVVENWLSTG